MVSSLAQTLENMKEQGSTCSCKTSIWLLNNSWIRDAQNQVYLALKSNEKCLASSGRTRAHSRAGGSHSEPSSRASDWCRLGRCLRTTSTSHHRSNTSDFTSNPYENLASLIHLDIPSHRGSTFAEKARTTSNPVCKLLGGRWPSFEKVPAS